MKLSYRRRARPRVRRLLPFMLVAVLLAACSGPESELGSSTPPADSVPLPSVTVTASSAQPSATLGPTAGTTSTATFEATEPSTNTAAPSATTSPTGEPSATNAPTATATTAPREGSVLPGSRVLSYYGHPSTPSMGILGEYSKEELLVRLQEQAAAYTTADPDTPVVLAFEIIGTVAQPNPGDDGTYVLYTGDEWIGEYVDFATANNMLLIIDLQIGHNTIPNEIERIRHWLALPNVHVALDPEFSTGPDRIPGEFIGEVDGHEVQKAVNLLAEIVAEHDLPNKILIIHQFEPEMIYNKDQITAVEGVDVVIDMDGFGGPGAKIENYDIFVRQELIEYGGIKLFYQQDDPLLTPAEIVALEPSPLVVIYQ
jgi:hypothetical protein